MPHLIMLLDFDVVFCVSKLDEVGSRSLPVVALQQNLIVFCCSSACEISLKLLCESSEVGFLVVDAVDDGVFASPFS